MGEIKSIHPSELPFVSHHPRDGREVPLLHWFDAQGIWNSYFPRPDGLLNIIHPLDAMGTSYFAATGPAGVYDVTLPLSEIVMQRFSFPDTLHHNVGIQHDFVNALASIHKYFVLLQYANANPDVLAFILLPTEIEFALSNQRSFYDLLCRLFVSIYRRFPAIGPDGRQYKPKEMKDSFHALVEKSDEDLEKKFNIPTPRITYLREREKAFEPLRKVRDKIVHHGQTLRSPFTLPDGFAFDVEREWTELVPLGIWPDELKKPNQLASVLALLVFLVDDMMGAMNGLRAALEQSFASLPTAVADGQKYYFRHDFLYHFERLDEYRAKHWFDPNEVLTDCHKQWKERVKPFDFTPIRGATPPAPPDPATGSADK